MALPNFQEQHDSTNWLKEAIELAQLLGIRIYVDGRFIHMSCEVEIKP